MLPAMAASLVEVQFEPGGRVARVAPGATLLDAAEAAAVDLAVGCTRGMCGTDLVRVIAGAGGLADPDEDERGTLERMGLGRDYRLSCSARVVSGPITVRIDGL